MGRFLVTTVGSHGDVHPYLGVARALAARGHEVAVAVHPHFHAAARRAGVEPLPIGAGLDYDAAIRDPRMTHPWRAPGYIMNLLLDHAPAIAREALAHARAVRADAILAHHICFGLPWLARDAGIPCAVGALAPMVWFNARDPVPTAQRHPGPGHARLARALEPVARSVSRWLGNPGLRRCRRALGVGPERPDFVAEFRAESSPGMPVLGLWSPAFRPVMEGDPEHARVVGFPWHDRAEHEGEDLSAPTRAFLEAGDPPVVFTTGTSAVHSTGHLMVPMLEAARRAGRRAIVLIGRGNAPPPGLPGWAHASEYEPFSLLLPLAACTVHHGGIGTTAQALRAGVPSVVTPICNDQFNNAVRVAALGVGGTIHAGRATPARLAPLIRAACEDPGLRARAAQVGAALAAEPDGSAAAADILERM